MDRTKISFAEAEGKAKFPAILKWGEFDQRLRAALWQPFFQFFDKSIQYDSSNFRYRIKGAAASILVSDFLDRQHQFITDFQSHFPDRKNFLETWANYFKQKDYVEILDFITFVMRSPDCPADLLNQIAEALDKPYSPYRLSKDAKTIFPAVGEQQGYALSKDLGDVFTSSFAGSKSHIQSALKALGDGDYRATVRESIHAVESAVRDFTNDPNAVLSKALKVLVGEHRVHKALGDAFDKLYAYSSDENGIRHALVFGENEKVGLDEAVFFLSVCTAFVGFLSRKKLGRVD